MKRFLFVLAVSLVMDGVLGCSSPMTTREKGAVVGGALGLGAGALFGDRR